MQCLEEKQVAMPDNVIEVQSLLKKYGSFTAVCTVSFNVRRGEIFALLGPNGAGKTTIVEILEFIKMPDNGFVNVLHNREVFADQVHPSYEADRDYTRIKEKVGVLPQGFNAFDLLTVYENLDYFARMYPKHVDIQHLIDTMGLKDKQNALFKTLSGGQKRRVGIAIALVNDPEIVFLDEPTTGLDPRARRDVWEAIKELKAKGKTIFLTTHYMEEAHYLSDRLCVIHKGFVVAQGTPEEMIDRYGGMNRLIFRECSPGAKERLMKAVPCEVQGNDIIVTLSGEESVAGISKAIKAIDGIAGSCKEISIKRPTLEDVFLNLTGETLVER